MSNYGDMLGRQAVVGDPKPVHIVGQQCTAAAREPWLCDSHVGKPVGASYPIQAITAV
ncbi:hypothetical protein I551_0025 [Mycobacterium ulcerans str. Harvey]|uniref:Uncharacterized protein n=1 Tax=Mycobacterium ulcerans str. Harvey TaxID=1299332 RepID=A0ABP3AQV3_MYCUL|nr:hypothetical protein I551_0025 [Mycobacterium ulcerans str. Harvey]